jgi:hypothetical protein
MDEHSFIKIRADQLQTQQANYKQDDLYLFGIDFNVIVSIEQQEES